MVLQETYEVIDGSFADIGTSNNYGTWTATDFTDATRITRNTEYTTLTPQDDWDTQTQTLSETDLVVECDLNSTYTSSSHFIRFYKDSTGIVTFPQATLGLNNNTWHHLKIIINQGNIQVFVDDARKINQSISNYPNQFRLVLSNASSTNLKYKNFVIYSI